MAKQTSVAPTNIPDALIRGRNVGLEIAAKIADAERAAAEKEEKYDLSPSIAERTRVRKNTAKAISARIRKEIVK